MKLSDRIYNIINNNKKPMTLKEIYNKIPDKPDSTIRARIYENIKKKFKRISKGVYFIEEDNSAVCIIEGNGRNLSFLKNNSIDCIITDHPWEDVKSNIGGSRKFVNSYDCFKYTIEDFKEKARVLKNGSFLVEILPDENANNYEYIYKIKQMAKQCGLLYYSKLPWVKGTFVSNTGRKTKNREDIMIFSKGKARALKPDKKKIKQGIIDALMSGTTKMLPAEINVQSVPRTQKIHQAEKPKELYKKIIEYCTLPGEIILDQFAGSGKLGQAILDTNRIGILIEKLHSNIVNIVNILNANKVLSYI